MSPFGGGRGRTKQLHLFNIHFSFSSYKSNEAYFLKIDLLCPPPTLPIKIGTGSPKGDMFNSKI